MAFKAELATRRNKVQRLLKAALILALMFAETSAQVEGQSPSRAVEADRNPVSIEGTWIFQIEIFAPGQPVATISSLISFADGGAIVTSTSVPSSPVFYGSWQKTEWNKNNAVFCTFAPDTAGTGLVLQKVTLKLQLTGLNELEGTGTQSTCDLQNESCVPGGATFQFKGKRIVIGKTK